VSLAAKFFGPTQMKRCWRPAKFGAPDAISLSNRARSAVIRFAQSARSRLGERRPRSVWRTASIVARARQRASVAPAGLTSDPFRCQFLFRAFLNVVAAVANGPARGNSPVCEPRLIWGGRTTRLSAPCDGRAVPKSGAARSNQCGAAVASPDWRQPGERSRPATGSMRRRANGYRRSVNPLRRLLEAVGVKSKTRKKRFPNLTSNFDRVRRRR